MAPDADLALYLCSEELSLADATLLHSRFRKALVVQRDVRLGMSRSGSARVVTINETTATVEAHPIAGLGAAKSSGLGGEGVGVCMALGTGSGDAILCALLASELDPQ